MAITQSSSRDLLLGTRIHREFEKAYRHGSAYVMSPPNIVELGMRAAMKRQISEVLAAESLSPNDLIQLLEGKAFKYDPSMHHNIQMDGAMLANKRLLAEGAGPQVCSSKEQLAQSLIYPLKLR